MSKSDAERSRAKRVRKAIREGKATEADITFLRRYAPADPLLARATAALSKPRPIPAPVERPTTVEPDATGTYVPIPDAPEDDENDEDDEPEARALDSEIIDRPQTCTIPDCPACSGRLEGGPQICATTQKPVWPPISMSFAMMIAGFPFWLIELSVYGWFRWRYSADVNVPLPTDLEREKLAESTIELVRRRFGALAAVDDLIAPIYPLSSYADRARRAAAKQLPGAKPDADE